VITAGRLASCAATFAIVVASCSSGDRTNDAVTSQPPAPPTTLATSPPSGAPSLDVGLQQTLDDWFGTGDIGGAVAAIGLADGTVHVATTGDAAPGEPAGTGDTMRIGSITKTYMAALTLRLDDIGVLDIDDPVATYLPGLGINDTVTIRDLLAHTSGIADPDPADIVALFREDSGQRFEYRDLIAFADIPTDSDPRSGEFAYANSGYHVLGGVIEAATSTNVAAALRTQVLDPAGLTRTHLAGAEPVPTPIVPGNVDLDGDGHEDTLAAVPYLAVETHMWSAGALVSTADDIIRFARALFAGTIISEHALAEMTDTSTVEHGHGLGIFDVRVDGKTVYGNSGAAPGFHANFAHHPTSGTTVVVFTNCPSCPVDGNDTWQLLVDLLAIADTNPG
jgi:D-alanyl-D-alanine carboxypeptidase